MSKKTPVSSTYKFEFFDLGLDRPLREGRELRAILGRRTSAAAKTEIDEAIRFTRLYGVASAQVPAGRELREALTETRDLAVQLRRVLKRAGVKALYLGEGRNSTVRFGVEEVLAIEARSQGSTETE